jgi:hypothetical protein
VQSLPRPWNRSLPEEYDPAWNAGYLLPSGGDKPLSLEDYVERLEPNVRLSAPFADLLQKELEKQKQAVTAARKLNDGPTTGRYPVRFTRDFISTALPHVDSLHNVRELLRLDAALRAQTGDLPGAAANCRGMLKAARSLGDEPFMISFMMRMTNFRTGIVALQRTLAQGELPDAELVKLDQLLKLELAEGPARLRHAMRAERASFDVMCAALADGLFPPQALFSGGRLKPSPWDEVVHWVDGERVVKKGYARGLKELSAAMQLLDLPESEQIKRFRELQSNTERQLPTLSLADKIGLQSVGVMARVVGKYYQAIAHMRVARAAIAVERYRLAQGRWPESLDTLVPSFLEAVPDDPFAETAARVQFEIVNGSPVIYSVGARDNREAKQIRFRLWPPAERGQAQPPPASERNTTP